MRTGDERHAAALARRAREHGAMPPAGRRSPRPPAPRLRRSSASSSAGSDARAAGRPEPAEPPARELGADRELERRRQRRDDPLRVLVGEDREAGDDRAARRRSPAAPRRAPRAPSGLCAASRISRRVAGDDLEPARELDRRGDLRDRAASSSPSKASAAAQRDGEVAALVRRRGARSSSRGLGSPARDRAWRARSAAVRSASASTSAATAPDDERRMVAEDRELLGRDLLARLAEPLGVLEADRGQRA